MLKNVLKIVFLGVVGFSLLVYLTAPKNINNKVANQNLQMSTNSFPKFFDVISNNSAINYQNIFANDKKKYLVVLNHDSLIVFKDLTKFTSRDDIVLLANISNTPWLIKQIAVNGELEKMYKDSKIPLINDSDGIFVKNLGLNDNKQNKYFIYKLRLDGKIEKVKEDSVKEGALSKALTEKELEKDIKTILENLK